MDVEVNFYGAGFPGLESFGDFFLLNNLSSIYLYQALYNYWWNIASHFYDNIFGKLTFRSV